ncbi:hypothetical protein SRABI106_04065 [Rahnella aquatilis]|nr:hypothetical protein SRABI106_04065 [Rahnella aquatilis]
MIGRIGQPIQVGFYRISIERRAVLESHIVAKINGEFGRIAVTGVIRRQHRHNGHFAVELEQAFKNTALNGIAQRICGVVRVKTGHVGIHGNTQIFGLSRRRKTKRQSGGKQAFTH